ncbi:MAG: MBL fold metallo-hydrolase, partial [Halobaculum sp.]
MHVDSLAVPTDTRAPTGTTNAVIVSGEERLLVDPAAATDALDAEVAEGIDHLAVTHTHPDHTGGVAAYADRATVWAKRGREARFREATGVTPDRTFAEGDRVGPARVLDTGGHAPDHVAFATPRGVVCGDLAVAEGSVAVAAPDGDVRAYLTALRRLHARDPSACYPGHGPTITDPRAVCARLIAHRLDREAKILAAVRDHGDRALDTAAVTDAAYEKDLTGVR